MKKGKTVWKVFHQQIKKICRKKQIEIQVRGFRVKN
jgi:hypothetical protein